MIEEKMRNNIENEPSIPKILVIDDDESIIEVIELIMKASFLCNSNIKIIKCCNLEEAKKAVDKYKPDILFFDHYLNGNVGFDLLEYAKSKEVKQFYSTTGDDFLATQYEQMGINKVKKIFIAQEIKKILAS